MSNNLLLIIDVQRGFINEWTDFVPKRVETLQSKFTSVFASHFSNPQASLYRQLLGWEKFAPGSFESQLAFTPVAKVRHLEKVNYSCITSETRAFMGSQSMKEVYLCGIATENSVLKTAVDLFELGITPIVLAFACASHDGADYHEAGIKLLKHFIGDAQVIEDPSHFTY